MLEVISPKSLWVFTFVSRRWFQGDSIQTPPKSHVFNTATLLSHRYLHSKKKKKMENTFSEKAHLYHSQITLYFFNFFKSLYYHKLFTYSWRRKETWLKILCQVSFHFSILKQILYNLLASYTYSFSNDWGTGQDLEVLEKSLQLLLV